MLHSYQSTDTSSYNSDCPDDEEIALALQAAEIAFHNELRCRFKSTDDLIHRLFVGISGELFNPVLVICARYVKALKVLINLVIIFKSASAGETFERGSAFLYEKHSGLLYYIFWCLHTEKRYLALLVYELMMFVTS